MEDVTRMEQVEVSKSVPISKERDEEIGISEGGDDKKTPSVLSRTLSRIQSNNDIVDPGPPPDGGLRAWSMAIAAHLILFNIWGFVNSFGLFQTYYVQNMKIGGESSVAWIGTAQVFILFGMGTWTGRGLDAGLFRIQFIVGSTISVLGLFMLSLCKTFWQLFLAQAICMGVGYGLCFVPTLALMSTYFDKNRSTAIALTVTGSSTGGLVFPAIAETMLPRVGFPWAIRTMAFVQLTLVVIAGLILKPRLPPRRSGPIVEWAAFKEAPYTIYLIGSFLYFWSVYVGWFFIGTFARNALGASQATGINLLLVLNGVGIVGRTLPAYIAQRWVGPLNMMIIAGTAASIVLFCWIAVDSVTGLWGFVVIYGLMAHGLQSLFPIVLTGLTKDQSKAGVRSGMAFSVMGLAVLTGPPIAGGLLEKDGGSFIGLQLFSAISMAAATVVFVGVRWVAVGWTRGKL